MRTSTRDDRSFAQQAALVGGATLAAASAVSLAGTVAGAAYLAHRLLTPERDRPDNVEILANTSDTVTLSVTEESTAPGRYGVWFADATGHVRVGDVVDRGPESVTRVLLGVDRGRPTPGPARWNGYYHGLPPQDSLGLATEEVRIPSDIGELPGWVIRPEGDTPTDPASRTWAVLLHGRGALREECLRAVPLLHELGITCVIPTYRNDEGAPASPDGKYNLGLEEWRDADAALAYAVANGAQEIVLFGWSMGGAIVLQTLAQSTHADRVSRVVLDGPVVDWGDVIVHHARINKAPLPLARLTGHLIGRSWAAAITGVHRPLDVAETNWEQRADELRHRMLMIHSTDDEFVPAGPSLALAARRPDLVTLVPWSGARHTKEWNTDPNRWEQAVREFLTRE